MAQYNDDGYLSMIGAGAIPIYARVVVSAAGTVDVAGLTDRGIGVAMNECVAAGDDVRVKLFTAPGTFPGIASEALAVAALLYSESDGEVQDTAQATAYPIGTALTAATADQDIIEWVPFPFDETAAS